MKSELLKERKIELEGMKYRDLQALAKELDLQANQTKDILIDEILKEEDKKRQSVELTVDESVLEEPKEEVKDTKVEELAAKMGVSVSVDKSAPKIPTKVRVRMKRRHKCVIGGERYYLEEGKHYNVPENVKKILAEADLLLPLI